MNDNFKKILKIIFEVVATILLMAAAFADQFGLRANLDDHAKILFFVIAL